MGAKELKLLQEKTEEFRVLRQQQQQEWQAKLEKRDSESESSVRERQMIQEMQTKAEEFRALQHQQEQKWQTELEEKDKQHKLEMNHKQKQFDTELEDKQKAVGALVQKPFHEKDEEINAKDLEIEKLQEELTLKENCLREELQHLKGSQVKVATENAELTKLNGSTQEIAKLKEDIETLRRENAELKVDLEAQRVQVCVVKL